MWKNSPIKADGRELNKAVILANNEPSPTTQKSPQIVAAATRPAHEEEGAEGSMDMTTCSAEGMISSASPVLCSPGTIQTNAFKRILGDGVSTLFDESSLNDSANSAQEERDPDASDGDISINYTPTFDASSMQPPSPQFPSRFLSNKENQVEESKRFGNKYPSGKSSSSSSNSPKYIKVSPSAKQSATVSSNSNGDLSQFFTFLKDFEEEMRSVTANASGGSIIEDDLSVVMNSVLQTPTKKLWRTAMEQHKLFQQQKIFE